MKIKKGVELEGLEPEAWLIVGYADRVWKDMGRPKGVTITSGLDGVHMKNSKHYIGMALDLRTRYFSDEDRAQVAEYLQSDLGKDYDVVSHSSHIHVEYDPK